MSKTQHRTPVRRRDFEVAPPQDLSERIRARAYELYLERNAGPGQDLDDWLRAEEEVIHPRDKAGH
jgi:hypothetical protein